MFDGRAFFVFYTMQRSVYYVVTLSCPFSITPVFFGYSVLVLRYHSFNQAQCLDFLVSIFLLLLSFICRFDFGRLLHTIPSPFMHQLAVSLNESWLETCHLNLRFKFFLCSIKMFKSYINLYMKFF